MLRGGVTPSRVLLTLDAVGGVWRYVLDLAGALDAHGVSCLLAGFGPPPNAAQEAACARLPRAELVWTDGKLDWMVQNEAELACVGPILADLARDWQADLLHVQLPTQLAGLELDLPCVVTAHGCVPCWWHAVQRRAPPAGLAWQWALNRAGFDRAGAVVVPSAGHAALVRDIYGPLPRVRVVHNAADVPQTAPGPREDFIFAAGRWWDEGKNGAVLDAAAAQSPWPVLMAGALQGPQGCAVRLRHARALGSLPAGEVLGLMRRATLFAAPSVYEPFGLAVLEAAMCGAALVLADIPVFREVWDGAACFVPPLNEAAWSRAFTALAGDAARCGHLAAQARARARQFSLRRHADGMLAAYAAAMAGHAAAREAAA